MRAAAACLTLALGLALVGCSSQDEGAGRLLDDAVAGDGILDVAPARLEVADLADPLPLSEDGCVTQVSVQPGGRTPQGPQWLVTFDLAAAPTDDVALAATLGEPSCTALVRGALEDIGGALGAIRADALDVTYLDPDGGRWLPGPVTEAIGA